MKSLERIMLSVAVSVLLTSVAYAAPGDLLGTVTLPGDGNCSVGGTFDCTYYMTMQGGHEFGCAGSTLLIYLPPAGGNGAAALVSTKTIVDGNGRPVSISALSWDPSRGKLWGAYIQNIYLIDIGDPTVSGNAVATWQFLTGVPGGLIDGLAWDPSDDTVYWSRDATCCVWQFSLGTGGNPPMGTLMNTIPVDGNHVSGVAIGSGNTLYVARNGLSKITRVNKSTGALISEFATTSGRVEDLVCDPITYAPKEAILAKDAYNALYEAFEVEDGTCPCVGAITVDIDIKPQSCPNPLNMKGRGLLPVAVLGSDELDVTTIDLGSIMLAGVPPKTRVSYEDVATPVDGDECECTTEAGDGVTDLTLKFDKQAIVQALGEVVNGETLVLTLTGELLDGTSIEGADCVVIRGKANPAQRPPKK